MKRLFLLLGFLFVLATALPAAHATSYFMSPSGSDGANGLTTGTAWASPNHALNCGDTITAATGTYSASHFGSGQWGTVTCAGGNNVAFLKCATFDACFISGSNQGVVISSNYWGIAGFEVTNTSASTVSCFSAIAPSSSTVHHIIFADNIANGCGGGGFITFNHSTTASSDYIVMMGNIAYNTAQNSSECYSGFSIYQPIASDAVAGTHIYIAGNFSYGNVDPATCAGGPSTDGEAVILDTFNGSQGGTPDYAPQAVVQNNIGFFNGGRGLEVFNNTNATIIFKYNTAFSDMQDNNQTNGCFDRGELGEQSISNVTYDHNLAMTRTGSSCSSAAIYPFSILLGNGTDITTNNWIYSPTGNTTLINSSSGFSLGTTNIAAVNPVFSNPVNPGAPSCGSFSSTVACMATVITDYTPSASSAGIPATNYGYQAVSLNSVTDPLYPAWLCNVTALPTGLVTPGCGSSVTATPVISPNSEAFSSPISVTITCSTGSSTIYYTTDGSTPTTGSTQYTGSFSVSTTLTVKAIATASGLTNSSVATATYNLTPTNSNVIIQGGTILGGKIL